MASKEVVLHEAAFGEAQAAYHWYASRNPAAAEAFVDELDHATEQIAMFPDAGRWSSTRVRNTPLFNAPVSVYCSLSRTRKGE